MKPASDDSRVRDTHARIRWIARVALVATTGWLLIDAALHRGRPWLVNEPLWGLQDSGRLRSLIISACLSGLGVVVSYAVLGCAAAMSLPLPRRRRAALAAPGPQASVWTLAALTMLAVVIVTAIVSMVRSGPGLRPPNTMDLAVGTLGGLLGCCLGIAGPNARRSPRQMLVRLAVVLLVAGGGFLATVLLSIESAPLPFEPAELTTHDRTRLTRLIRSHSPRAVPPGRTRTLTLTGRDIDLLLAWGLSLGSQDRKARVELARDHARLRASIRLPVAGAEPMYLNATIGGRVGIEGGRVRLDVTELQIGRAWIPRALLWLLSPGLSDRVTHDPRLKPVFDQIKDVEIAPSYVSATYGRIDMPSGFRSDIFGDVGPSEQVVAALRAQFEQIARIARDLPPPDQRFAAFIEGAFRLAHERSQSGDPVVENRAAIIALGISLGHDIIGEFVTALPYDAVPPGSLRLTRKVPLRGRVDWSRHFLVSAALAVLSTEGISYDIGILKEELDSAGGSGFSFADLAADRAGTRFGQAATRDEAAARAMQQRLMAGFDVDAFVPPMADLPEGLQEDRLQAEYGGTTGARYREMVGEIDGRIGGCEGYE